MANKEKKYVIDNDKLMSEWHWEKNSKLGLNPDNLTYGSEKKAWWICKKGHEWEANIKNRYRGSECPYCQGKKLLKGFNDFATIKPELVREWHSTKNGNITPDNIMSCSNEKIWWVCKEGHEYQTCVSNRTYGTGCPYCSGKRVITGVNDLETLNPKLAKEWHPTKNGNIKAKDVKSTSHKKVWWLGKCGHEWETAIRERVAGSNCPYCGSQKLLVGYNDLATDNPELAKEWNYEKNIGLIPQNIMRGSHKKYWWVCEKGHEWEASVQARNKGDGCPYCGRRKVLAGYNDLETTHPELVKEWNFEKNNILPNEIMIGHNNKVWWICEKGHEWEAAPNNRRRGDGCPHCSNERKTSFAEQAILFYCKKVTMAINRYTDLGKEIDIYLPEYNIGIEYNGLYWHKDKEEMDREKIKYFYDKGIRIITVKESYTNSINGDAIEHNYNDDSSMNFVIKNIFDLIGISCDEPNINEDRIKIIEQYVEIEKENSIAIKVPESVNEWNYKKNGKLLPTMVSYGSGKKVWWKCKECGHEWEAVVSGYTRGRRCPECAIKLKAKNKFKPVRCIETGIIYPSIKSAGEINNINQISISCACRGKYNTAGGYHWEFVKDDERN